MKDEKLNYLKTFIIGLGFFTTGVSWALYNSYMPIFLRDYINSSVIIGFIMALDNILAIFFYPMIGALSDRIRTKVGRRMPFIIVGIPIAAFFFALIPFDKTIASFFGYSLQGDLTFAFVMRMILVVSFIVGMTIYRSPVIALMPDVTPDKHRSTANGIINLMGGVGSVFAFFVGSRLYAIDRSLPFIVTSVIMVISLILLILLVKEPKVPPVEEEKKDKVKIIPAMKEILVDKDKSALLILFAILFWFMAYQSLETWFTTYATKTLVKVEKIENLSKTSKWSVLINKDEKKDIHYISDWADSNSIQVNKGDTIVFLGQKEENKETIILKKNETIVLKPDGDYETLTIGSKYNLPSDEKKYIILAENGNTLIIEDRLERDITELQSKFTIAKAENCSISNDNEFCREVKENEGSNAITYFGVVFILISLPAGLISKKIGRKRTIMIGIVGLVVVLGVSLFIKNIDILTYVLAIGGAFWAFININSITMIWEIATNERLGTYTGLYYFFSQTAAVVAPPLFGLFFDLIGYNVLFPVSIGFFALAFICMMFVRKGEYIPLQDKLSKD